MIVGIVKETFPGEKRVAIVPAVVPSLLKAKNEVVVQSGAGEAAGFADKDYQAKGAKLAHDRAEVFNSADVLCQVRTPSANPGRGKADLALLRPQTTLVGLADPLGASPDVLEEMAATGARCFGLELLPRITRAQSMDVLSSQATVAGYAAVLLAAGALPRMFPMMMTAAGTIPPAKVFIIGAGVAGLQAIASAKRLGAVVQAYDVRPAVKEQVESLGARFVQLALDSAEGAGGYAKAMDEEFYRKQRELMAKVVGESDVVITTAAVPGGKPPLLITADMVGRMPRGGIVVDLAAKPDQPGGNCELTRPDETTVTENGVTIIGPTNLPATVPQTASQMYARNVAAFLALLTKDGALSVNKDDEIVRETLICEDGNITHPRLSKRRSTVTA